MTLVLETERLFLRELLLNDVEPVASLWADPAVMKHCGGAQDASAVRAFVHEQQRSYREHGFGVWAVIHRDSASFVGQAGIEPPHVLRCELGPAYWESGIASEVLVAIRDHAFSDLGLETLTAGVPKKSPAGRKLADKLGMRPLEDNASILYRVDKDDR